MAIEVPEAEVIPSEVLWSAVAAPQLLAAGGTHEALLAAVCGPSRPLFNAGFHNQ